MQHEAVVRPPACERVYLDGYGIVFCTMVLHCIVPIFIKIWMT